MDGGAKSAFDAVTDDRTRVVVLGSLPGEMSLEQRQYYANPTNQFWRLISAVVERDLVSLSYEQRLSALLDARIGLWDVIGTAHRHGSSDSSIRHARPRALQAFADSLPSLRALAFNGQKSATIGRRQMDDPARHALVNLPSSSAAYCRIGYEAKLRAWLGLKTFLA